MPRFRFYIVSLAILCVAAPPVAATSLQDLYAHYKVSRVLISPTGEYLAIRLLENEKHSVLFLDRATLQPTGSLQYRGESEIGSFWWANHERIVAQVYELGKGGSAPRNYGELAAANFDGSRPETIFGYRAGGGQKEKENAWGQLIDALPDDEREVLISYQSMSASFGRRPVARKLDIYTGEDGERMHTAKYAGGAFRTDADGVVRMVYGIDENRDYHVEGLPADATEWIEIKDLSFGDNFHPVAISDDKRYAYVLSNLDADKVGLYKLALDGSEYKQVYANDQVDITNVELTPDGRSVFAMRIDRDVPSYLVMSKTHEEAAVFKQLLQLFPGNAVNITSDSDDGRFWVVHTSSDVDPGTYYLLDREEQSMHVLFKSKPDVNSDDLSQVEPISFDSFDGLKIHGYFTPAKSNKEGIAPMVVMVHGGPRSRDYWGFDPDVQALAINGYSVLQINFRGSDGYGNAFMTAGNLHWGDHIQQDIIAGTEWAINEGRADKAKICIMGASFGAYSAVQSAALRPDLYACGIANAGIYDLELLYKEGDIEDFYTGKNYLNEVVGSDEEQLRAFSPIHNVAALKAPLFIAHGKEDDRAPYEHAKRLRKALDEHDKEYEWFAKGRESHGFYDTGNQIEYMEGVLKFLDRHLR